MQIPSATEVNAIVGINHRLYNEMICTHEHYVCRYDSHPCPHYKQRTLTDIHREVHLNCDTTA